MHRHLFLATTLLLVNLSSALANKCAETDLFDCPRDQFCTEWNDGCNNCSCDGNSVRCTEMYCDCYDTDSCVPTCYDNSACLSQKQPTNEIPLVTTSCALSAPFVCPPGEFCNQWSVDGCNTCSCRGSESIHPFCTVKMCTSSSVDTPTCLDNDRCMPTPPPTPNPLQPPTPPPTPNPMRPPTPNPIIRPPTPNPTARPNPIPAPTPIPTINPIPRPTPNPTVNPTTPAPITGSGGGVIREPILQQCTQSAPFRCPQNQYCTRWNNGCNDCVCMEGEAGPACTQDNCRCLEDGSCRAPTCLDNQLCVPLEDDQTDNNNNAVSSPAPTNDPLLVQVRLCVGTYLFDCPPGQYCTEWEDGCNSCACEEDITQRGPANCSDRVCPCQEDNSCGVPICTSNEGCIARANNNDKPPKDPVLGGGVTQEIKPPGQGTMNIACIENTPFDCKGSGYCTEWSDGCYDCSCRGSTDQAICTLQTDCQCWEDNNDIFCGPYCKDNNACIPQKAGPLVAGVISSSSAGIQAVRKIPISVALALALPSWFQ